MTDWQKIPEDSGWKSEVVDLGRRTKIPPQKFESCTFTTQISIEEDAWSYSTRKLKLLYEPRNELRKAAGFSEVDEAKEEETLEQYLRRRWSDEQVDAYIEKQKEASEHLRKYHKWEQSRRGRITLKWRAFKQRIDEICYVTKHGIREHDDYEY